MLCGNQLHHLRAELYFVAVNGTYMMNILTLPISQSYIVVDIYNKMVDMLSWMKSPDFLYAKSSWENAMFNASVRLAQYMEGHRQPTSALLKSLRVFDPFQSPFWWIRLLTMSSGYQQCLLPHVSGRLTWKLLPARIFRRTYRSSWMLYNLDFHTYRHWQGYTVWSLPMYRLSFRPLSHYSNQGYKSVRNIANTMANEVL